MRRYSLYSSVHIFYNETFTVLNTFCQKKINIMKTAQKSVSISPSCHNSCKFDFRDSLTPVPSIERVYGPNILFYVIIIR